jgi:ADP-heptose:LPS heptosyltransferase
MKSFVKQISGWFFGDNASGRAREARAIFFIKWTFLGWVGRMLLIFFGAKTNKSDWEKRVLIVGPGGIGDMIMATPALRTYREHFKEKKIYFVVVEHSGFKREMFDGLIDEVVLFDGQKFQSSPWYRVKIVNQLRRIGFSEVVNEAMGAKDLTSKILATSLSAERVVGYEGPGVELVNPESESYIRFAKKHIFPHYTKLVPSIDKDFQERHAHPHSAILHHVAIAESVTKKKSLSDISTVFTAGEDAERSVFKKYDLRGKRYIVFVVSCVDPARCWEVEKFAEVARYVHGGGFEIVVIGTRSQKAENDAFRSLLSFGVVDTTGELSLSESAALIHDAYCLIADDTGPVHIAVALGVPSICIPTAGHLAMHSLYGRHEVNHWVYKDIGCLYDDARCVATVPRGAPAPCLQAVSAGDVIREFGSLEAYLSSHPVRDEAFLPEFEGIAVGA